MFLAEAFNLSVKIQFEFTRDHIFNLSRRAYKMSAAGTKRTDVQPMSANVKQPDYLYRLPASSITFSPSSLVKEPF